MNPDSPKTPRQEMETWLTSLLLGELSEGEAAAVRELLKHDPELAKLHDRLKETISLVRETVPHMETPPATAEPLKLSEERRKKLLASFLIPPLKIENRKPRRKFQFRLIEVLVVLAALAMLAAMLLPALSKRPTTLALLSGTRSETSEEISAPAVAAAPPPDTDQLESTRAHFGKYLEQSQQILSESKSEGDRRILDNRVQISGQPAEPAMRQSDASSRGVDPTTGLPVDSLAAVASKPMQIVLPEVAESAGDTEGNKVTLGNEFSWGVSERNGRRFDDGKTKLGQSATLFAVDPQAAGVPGSPEASSVNALPRHYAYVPPGSGPSAVGQSGAEATITLSRERLEALKNSSDAKAVEDQVVAGGAFIQPTRRLRTETLRRGGAIAENITPAAPEQSAFMRRYGLPPAKPAGGMGGGGGGGGVASIGGIALGLQPTPSQTAPETIVAGVPVSPPVLGDLPTAGEYFRSVQPSSESPRLGFSLLGPKSQSDKPALGETLAFGAVALDDGLQASDPLKDGTTLAGRDTSKDKDSDWFAGRPLARNDGWARPATPPVVAAGDSLGRQSDPIVLPWVEQETVGTPATDIARREVLARNGAVPQRSLRESRSGVEGKATGTTPPARGDEQLLVEARLNDADGDRAKNRGQVQQEDRGRAAERVPTTSEEVVLQKNEGDAATKARSYHEAKVRLEELQRFRTLQNLRVASQGTDSAVPQSTSRINVLEQSDEQEKKVREAQKEVDRLRAELSISDFSAVTSTPSVEADVAQIRRTSTNAPIPQPEIQTSENNFSTFSLNVSDVSFKLAAASLEKGQMPDAASVRSEEFINAFDYRDPEPSPGAPIAFAWERARYPFAHNRDLLRFSLKTAAAGRQAGRPLNIVLLLDNSGSMERADRVRIIREALRVLASQLQPQDKLSVITFARTPRLIADGISGDKAVEVTEAVTGVTPQGGTNFEEGMNLAYATALRHYLAGGINRVVMLTDGAANLGDVEPESLKKKVETHRKQGVALDCFGIGWEGFNDDLLEVLSRNGDGRYGFINSPEEAATDFAGQLAGALKVAASDVKVQVEFNPKRVTSYRQIGYAKHQLTKEQFRDNTVDAAEIAAQEAGNALYTVETNPTGEGPLCTVRVRFRFAGTWEYREQAWDVSYNGNALALEQSSPAMRLAASSAAFAEWLVASPFAGEVTPDRLLGYLSGVPEIYGADARPKKLEWMIRQAKSLQGR